MTAYMGYLLLAGIQLLFFYRGGKLQKEYFNVQGYLTLCCIELIILAGVRGYAIGADTERYLAAIDYYGKMSPSELLRAGRVYPFNFEIGYLWLTKLSCLLRLGKTGFLFIVAIITYVPLFRLIKLNSNGVYVSLLCYFAFGFFAHSLGIFRQMIAISIIVLGQNYIVERKFLKYLAIVLLATTFHTTALVAILLYFLYGVKWQRIITWIIPIEIGLLIFGRFIIVYLTRIFPRYADYLGGKHDTQGGTYLMLIFLNLVFIASVLFRARKDKQIEKEKQNENLILCALLLAIFLQCLGYSMGLIGRAVSYYSIYIIIAIPNLIYNIGNNNVDRHSGRGEREMVSLVTITCLFVLIFLTLHENQYIVPYHTFWNQ